MTRMKLSHLDWRAANHRSDDVALQCFEESYLKSYYHGARRILRNGVPCRVFTSKNAKNASRDASNGGQ